MTGRAQSVRVGSLVLKNGSAIPTATVRATRATALLATTWTTRSQLQRMPRRTDKRRRACDRVLPRSRHRRVVVHHEVRDLTATAACVACPPSTGSQSSMHIRSATSMAGGYRDRVRAFQCDQTMSPVWQETGSLSSFSTGLDAGVHLRATVRGVAARGSSSAEALYLHEWLTASLRAGSDIPRASDIWHYVYFRAAGPLQRRYTSGVELRRYPRSCVGMPAPDCLRVCFAGGQRHGLGQGKMLPYGAPSIVDVTRTSSVPDGYWLACVGF